MDVGCCGAAPGTQANQDYFETWRNSPEYRAVQNELHRLEEMPGLASGEKEPDTNQAYAASFWKQYIFVVHRLFQQYWRTPSYIYSKFAMAVLCSLFNGFTYYKSQNSMQGLKNQMLSIFSMFVVLTTLAQQYVPLFVTQRDLYEARERPSKTFSWLAFIAAQITAEIPYQVLAATISFFSWYYPVGLYRNAVYSGAVTHRGVLMWLIMTLMFIYSSTLAQFCISWNQLADYAANWISLLLTISMIFCGVIATKTVCKILGFPLSLYSIDLFNISYDVNWIGDSFVKCAPTEILTFHHKPLEFKMSGLYGSLY